MPDFFLVQSQLSRVDLPCSLGAMMLVMKREKKGNKGLEYFVCLKNLVDLLKSLVVICIHRLYGLCALYADLRRKYEFCT